MKNVKGWVREVMTAHRDEMAKVEIIGLSNVIELTTADLHNSKKLLESEQRKTRKMTRKTQDWNNASGVYKAAYLIHDVNCHELKPAVAELDMDLKTLKSRMNPSAAKYETHPWNIDVDVYIYGNSRKAGDSEDDDDASDISPTEVEAYFEAIKKCLRGEFHISWGCGDRGFGFWADAADEEKLNELLGGLEDRGCIVDYPDWDYITSTTNYN